MDFKRPSSIDQHFETRPHLRPTLDLGISPIPYILPASLRQIDIGPSKLADYIIGFAIDEAVRQDVRPVDFAHALDIGDLTLQTFIFKYETSGASIQAADGRYFAQENQASYVASLASRGDRLTVSGGIANRAPSSVMYQREGGLYRPVRSVIATDTLVREYGHAVIENYKYVPLDSAAAVPDEFLAAEHLNNVAKFIDEGLIGMGAGDIAVRADLSSTMFGDLRGRGLT